MCLYIIIIGLQDGISLFLQGEGMYPHFSHQHYQMYQQHFRATQHESRATPSPYTRYRLFFY